MDDLAKLIRIGVADVGDMIAMLDVAKRGGLAGIDLSHCDLSNSTFRNLDFRNANFSYSDLEGSKFVECNLLGAAFFGVDRTRILFENCELDRDENSQTPAPRPPTPDVVLPSVPLRASWPQQMITPNKLMVTLGSDPRRIATVVAEPLERGFGVTLGNALRRILLSSLQGAAVQSVHIDGVLHEFSSIAGVREDVTDIVLNIKDIAIKMDGDGPKRMVVKKSGPGTVVAGDIQTVGDIVVLNPDLVLCTLDEGAEIRMEFTVNTGKGYVPSERNRQEDSPIGLIPVDSLYSPVLRVAYKVENVREGENLDYDRLKMTIETNGAVGPEDALAYAARILQDQLNVFVNFAVPRAEHAREVNADLAFNPAFLKKIEELELSVRSANCLRNDNVVYIGDLVQKTESELMHTPNFGRKSLNEIKEVLAQLGLHLGIEVPGWPPENLEQLSKRFDDEFALTSTLHGDNRLFQKF